MGLAEHVQSINVDRIWETDQERETRLAPYYNVLKNEIELHRHIWDNRKDDIQGLRDLRIALTDDDTDIHSTWPQRYQLGYLLGEDVFDKLDLEIPRQDQCFSPTGKCSDEIGRSLAKLLVKIKSDSDISKRGIVYRYFMTIGIHPSVAIQWIDKITNADWRLRDYELNLRKRFLSWLNKRKSQTKN